MTIFSWFLLKRTRIDLQGPMVLERHQDVKTRHLVCICGEKSNIWHLYTFDSLSSLIRKNEILKFLEKNVFFNEENTNELAIMFKSGKIHFFFNLSWNHEFLGYESGQGVKKLDFFSIFRNINFWSILTTFDPVLSRKHEVTIFKIVKNHESGLCVSQSKLCQK